jgi:hypothetical protein
LNRATTKAIAPNMVAARSSVRAEFTAGISVHAGNFG